jgi:hypothetical protein
LAPVPFDNHQEHVLHILDDEPDDKRVTKRR